MNSQPQPAADTNAAPPVLFDAAIGAVNRVVQMAGAHLAQIVEHAQPTPTLLRSLTDELQRAIVKPKSAAHPELVDPDVYWQRAVWPQASAVVKASRKILVEVAGELRPAVAAAEREIQQWLTYRMWETQNYRASDPDHCRAVIVDEIALRCQELHNVIAMVDVLRPPLHIIDELQADADERRRKDVAGELKRQRGDFERQHGKQAYEATHDERAATLDAELRARVPWRHVDLAIEAHRQVRVTLGNDVSDLIDDVTQPILGIGERMVKTYDQTAFAGASYPT